jgi:hypothetical protein
MLTDCLDWRGVFIDRFLRERAVYLHAKSPERGDKGVDGYSGIGRLNQNALVVRDDHFVPVSHWQSALFLGVLRRCRRLSLYH